jgi:hypothetical protein
MKLLIEKSGAASVHVLEPSPQVGCYLHSSGDGACTQNVFTYFYVKILSKMKLYNVRQKGHK